ncbi:MAG: adenosylcobinamide-GDP ribazoletransferase [Actinomycetota bacterium]
MDALFEALAFLTILPLGRRAGPPGHRSLVAFPLVGLLVGGVWVGVGWLGARLWAALPAAALVLVADVVLTGGLHIDAVADLADGWASRKPAEAALEVMRDPAVGAVGAAVLGTTLLLRWSLLVLLVDRAASGHWWLLLVPPVASRTAMVVGLGRPSRSGRPGRATQEGEPSLSLPHKSPKAASLTDSLSGAGWGVIGAALAIGVAIAGAAGSWRGVVAIALGAALAAGGARWSARRFGRLTGDAVGAAGMAAEIVATALLTARG